MAHSRMVWRDKQNLVLAAYTVSPTITYDNIPPVKDAIIRVVVGTRYFQPGNIQAELINSRSETIIEYPTFDYIHFKQKALMEIRTRIEPGDQIRMTITYASYGDTIYSYIEVFEVI